MNLICTAPQGADLPAVSEEHRQQAGEFSLPPEPAVSPAIRALFEVMQHV